MSTELAESEAKEQELGVKELASSVYFKLLDKYPQFKLRPTKPFESMIADDGDTQSWGRGRQGFMIYDNSAVLRVGEKKWIAALATRHEGYAGDDFSCDLKIFEAIYPVEISDSYLARVAKTIRDRHFFEDSVIVGTNYGGLCRVGRKMGRGTDWAPFNSYVIEKLGDYKTLISKTPEFDSGYLDWVAYGAPLSWAVKSTIKYRPEAPDFVFNAVTEVLELYSK